MALYQIMMIKGTDFNIVSLNIGKKLFKTLIFHKQKGALALL